MPATGKPPEWVWDALGRAASDVRRIPWGFTNETWMGTAPDGARYVATLMASPAKAAALLARAPGIAALLAGVGLETPVPIAARSDPERGYIVAAWLDGTPGMVSLGEARGPATVGLAAGEVWRRLGSVDPAGTDLDDLWTRPAGFADAARAWLASAASDLTTAVAAAVSRRIDGLIAVMHDRPSRFVHGDLVPANLLLRDGATPGVLDLETVRIGDPLFDAAWFRWIVGYHHPAACGPAWPAFTEAALLPQLDTAGEVLLAGLPTARILEILADANLDAQARRRWLAQLQASVGAASVLAGPGGG
jgi:aminoglycoside phosphotransferase (APT) family kinase protein